MNSEQFDTLHEILAAIYVQISRMYDIMAIIADQQGADIKKILDEHESGRILGPRPLLIEEGDTE